MEPFFYFIIWVKFYNLKFLKMIKILLINLIFFYNDIILTNKLFIIINIIIFNFIWNEPHLQTS